MNQRLRTRELRQVDELEALTSEWWALWRRLPQTTPFQAPAWLIPWWRSFEPGELRTIAVEADGRLVGLAPLYLETGPLGRRLLPVGISLSDYLDLLLDPDLAKPAGAAIMAYLAEADWPWDVVELQELPASAAALSLPLPRGMQESAAEDSACPVLSLMPGDGGWISALPRNKRRNLQNARNRAKRQGAQCRRAGAKEAEDFVELLFALHGARWQSRGTTGLLGSEQVRSFHRSAIGGLVESGLARLYRLEANGQAIGAYYGFQHQGRAMAYLIGFDPNYSSLSPGTLVLGHAIEAAVEEGCYELHFLRGREAYKYGWGAKDRWNRRRLFRRRAAP